MEMSPIFKDLTTADVPLEKIYLDPNNPRFITMNWEVIPDSEIPDHKVQKKTIERLESEFSVDRLVLNMEMNGYLPIDRVILRSISDNNYVVLEGNRRICAAKQILKYSQESPDSISREILDSIKKIPCLIYTGVNSEASWIFQGLRHILGIQEWSAFNKAMLIVKLMEDQKMTQTEVGQKFGLTAFGVGQWARGYYAFKQARDESDYTRELDERAYPYFQEIFNRSNSATREWLNWNEQTKKFTDELNFNEFLSWLYPRDTEEVDESLDPTTILGDWKRKKIVTRDDIRILSYLLSKAPQEFDLFRREGNLEKAYSIAIQKEYEKESKKTANPSDELFQSLDLTIKSLENTPYKILKDSALREKLLEKLTTISSLIRDLQL